MELLGILVILVRKQLLELQTEHQRIWMNILPSHPSHQKRIALVSFSLDHPDLLDARVTGHIGFEQSLHYLWQENRTGGMQKILPFHKIPSEKYYTEYQVHVVMGGYGAAFRSPIIFRQGIAVILQEYPWEEWFIQYMKPFVH